MNMYTALFLVPIAALVLRADLGSAAQASQVAASEAPLTDLPADAFRLRLLELAFDAASAIPAYPQVKERCASQQEVVQACLALDQPLRALSYLQEIENWRRGVAYAELAYYCAERGVTSEVVGYLDLAEDVATNAVAGEEQGWRVDRIRATIAKTYLALGHVEDAERYGTGLAESEIGRVLSEHALYLDAEGFEERLRAVDAIVEVNNFDQVKNALEALVPVYEHFYEDEVRRQRVQEKVVASWGKLPNQVRVDLVLALADVAAERDDQASARALLAEAQKLLQDYRAEMDVRVPLLARLARMRHLAGEPEAARRDVDAALAEFERGAGELLDARRAAVLRPLAEAYQTMGHKEAALMVYRRAVVEGGLNPNMRPRAEDLASNACSMALNGVEPDEALWKSMEEIKKGLKDPWQVAK